MKFRNILALGAAGAVCVLASTSFATTFLFSYSGDGGANGASGTLTATANGDGTYTATTGTITEFGPVATGVGTLIANPAAPAQSTSPSGAFYYDDQLLPMQNPLLLNGGLLFDVAGSEVNIFSNGPGPDTYTLASQAGASTNGDFALSAAVPEPATWGLMLVGFGLAGAVARSSRERAAVAA
jgi:hypothetical protein